MNGPDLTFQTLIGNRAAAVTTGADVVAHPTPNQALPYIHIGESDIRDYPGGHEVICIVKVYSSAEGPHEAKGIQDALRLDLHDGLMTLDSWQFTAIREEFSDVIFDPTDQTWQSVQRFRALAQAV